MVFISITRLRVRSFRYLLPFFIQTLRSAQQAKTADGNLGVSLLREAHNTFWTRTVWVDEASMKAYRLAGVHRQVMHSLLEWCDEAAVVHWVQESPQPPTWSEAYQQIQQSGRSSKVNHPSAAQSSFKIPVPQVRKTGELRFK